jgi:3-hydroxybutyryl-CoA dehydrogenase
MWAQVKRGGLGADDAHAAMGRVKGALGLEHLRKAQFVVEAVTEDEDVKKSVFKALDQVRELMLAHEYTHRVDG